MELKTAIEILEYHQEWRLGKREDMIHEPKKLTEALDIVIAAVKNVEPLNEAQTPELGCSCTTVLCWCTGMRNEFFCSNGYYWWRSR